MRADGCVLDALHSVEQNEVTQTSLKCNIRSYRKVQNFETNEEGSGCPPGNWPKARLKHTFGFGEVLDPFGHAGNHAPGIWEIEWGVAQCFGVTSAFLSSSFGSRENT